MSLTPIFQIPEMAQSQAQPHLTFNQAIRILEALAQAGVTSRSVADPPEDFADGDRYIVAGGATTFWSDHVDEIAIGIGGTWVFVAPRDGFSVWVADEAHQVRFRTGSPNGWEAVNEGGGGGSGGTIYDQSIDANPGAAVDDFNPSGWNSASGMNRLRITPNAGGSTINGVDAAAAFDGQAVLFCNESGVDSCNFPHEAGTSAGGNQFRNEGASGPVVLVPYQCRVAVRTSGKWRFT